MGSFAEGEARWAAILFFAIALLQVIPIWSVQYVPTGDGPEHVYNSLVLHDLLTGRRGVIADVYAIDWRPHPNWIGHAVMALLMFVLPPLVTEKILLTATILLFLTGAWMFAGAVDPRSRTFAFLALPFAYHALLQTGLYNFCISTGLLFVIVAIWWRRRDDPGATTIGIVVVLLLLCYFSHPLATCVAIASIGILWLATLSTRPLRTHARHLIALVPIAPLMMWFALRQGTGTGGVRKPIAQLLAELVDIRILLTFSPLQTQLGRMLFAIGAVLFIATLILERRQRREADGFLAIIGMLVALYLWAPETVAGGQAFGERIALFLYLMPLAWFSSRVSRWVHVVIPGLMTIIALGNVIFITGRFRHYERTIRTIVRTADPAAPNTRLLPMMFDRSAEGAFVPILWHCAAYAATEKRMIELDNFEARVSLFPIRFRPGSPQPDVGELEVAPERLDVAAVAPYARYILTWKLPPNRDVAVNLDRLYHLINARDRARLYERRSSAGVEVLSTLEQLLLPLAGTSGELGAAQAARWRIDQSVTNNGARPVHVILSHCGGMAACEFDVKPGERVPIFGSDSIRPFIYAWVPHDWSRLLSFSTVARRTDLRLPSSDVPVPAVPVQHFGNGRIVIPGVRFAHDVRLNLRLYTIGTSPPRATVRITSDDNRVLATRSVPIYVTNFYTVGDFGRMFPNVDSRANVTIEANTKLWAFVTETDAQGGSTVYLPK